MQERDEDLASTLARLSFFNAPFQIWGREVRSRRLSGPLQIFGKFSRLLLQQLRCLRHLFLVTYSGLCQLIDFIE
jgi:hypothetical protein